MDDQPSEDKSASSQPDNSHTPPPLAGSSDMTPEVQKPAAPSELVTDGSVANEEPQPVSSAPPPQIVTSDHVGGRSRKRRLKLLVALIVLAVLVIGALAGYNHWHKKKTPAAAQDKTVSLIRVGSLQADYGKLYPDMSVNDYSYTTNAQLFEGLVRYEGKSNIVPDLASTWTNPDDTTWLFTIKKDIKFHDGHTLTANDVKYSLDTVRNSGSDLAETFASSITGVDVTDTDKVKITTDKPDPTLLNKLVFLYVIDASPPKGSEPSQAGTGPYEIKPGTTPSDQNVQMVAFNGYHDGRPQTQALTFSTEDEVSNLVKAFQNHKYDIVGYVPPDKLNQVRGAYQFATTESDVDFIGFNTVKPGPLQNKQVREAIRYAVDANAIGRSRGTDVTLLSQLVPPSIPGYNPTITPYKQDINKAKSLLAKAGYPNGVTLRYSVSSDVPQMNQELVKQLKQAGITLTLDEHHDFDEFINYFTSGQAEMFSVDYSSDTLDALDIYQTTLQSANYDNPKLTDLLDQAGNTVDPAKRLKLLQQAATIIDQDVAVVPLTTEKDHWLMDKNYAIQQDMPSTYLPVYFYKVHLK